MNTARALTDHLAALLRREHESLAEFLVALADFDRRRAWAELGYASLFHFLHRELRLSKGAAQYRKVAAELIQEVPAIAEALRDGRMCFTTVLEAAKVVTPENWKKVLPRFYGLSRSEAAEVVAELQPHPAPPTRTVVTSVRAAPRSAGASETSAPLLPAPVLEAVVASTVTSPQLGSPVELTLREHTSPMTPPARTAGIVPLTADDRRLHLTVSKRFLAKLAEARDALSHSLPGASEEQLLEAGLDLLLVRAAKRRGVVEKPQKKLRPSKPEHPAAHVRREVWKRDGGRCQWRLANGEICGSTHRLQLDHIVPLARGGTSTSDNTRLLCGRHNLESARIELGAEWMDQWAPRVRKRPASSPDSERPPIKS